MICVKLEWHSNIRPGNTRVMALRAATTARFSHCPTSPSQRERQIVHTHVPDLSDALTDELV